MQSVEEVASWDRFVVIEAVNEVKRSVMCNLNTLTYKYQWDWLLEANNYTTCDDRSWFTRWFQVEFPCDDITRWNTMRNVMV